MKTSQKYTALLAALVSLIACSCGKSAQPQPEVSAEMPQTTVTETETSTAAASESAAGTAAVTSQTDISAQVQEENSISFAERAVGTYSCKTGSGEILKAKMINICGNLYAECSLSDDEGGEYSVWTAEIIPTQAGIFMTAANECDAGVVMYSPMSNAGRYWKVPDTGKVSLKENGIVFDGICLTDMGEDHFELTRTEETPSDAVSPQDSGEQPPEEIYGLWKTEYNGAYTFVKFEKTDGKNTVKIFRKAPGTEAVIRSGDFSYEDGYIIICCETPGGGPFYVECPYTADGGNMMLEYFYGDEESLFVPAEEKDIPLTVLADAGDISAIKGNMTVTDANGDTRNVIPQFKMCDDVESNGGLFVRLGDLVYYRELDEGARGLRSSYGNYFALSEAQGHSRICWYDTRTGEKGTAFEDGGFGSLYYMNGMFYTQFLRDSDSYEISVRRCYPDGSCSEEVFVSDYNTIQGVSEDNTALLISSYKDDTPGTWLSMYDGTFFSHELDAENGGDTEYIGMGFAAGNDIVTVSDDPEEDRFVFRQHDAKTGSCILLGEYEYDEDDDPFGIPVVDGMFRDGDQIYFVVSWYVGDSTDPDDLMIFKAVPGTENSTELVRKGFPEGFEYKLPYVSIENGTLKYSEHPAGIVGFSEGGKGDLVYYDTADSSTVLIENYADKDIYDYYAHEVEKGETMRILQSAEYIGGAVYIAEADGLFDPDYDSGYITDYELKAMRWMKIIPGKEPEVIAGIS